MSKPELSWNAWYNSLKFEDRVHVNKLIEQYKTSLIGEDFNTPDEFASQQKQREAVEFAEWIDKNHWWKSTDLRFPATLGRWTTAFNGNVKFEETKTTNELYPLFKEKNK